MQIQLTLVEACRCCFGSGRSFQTGKNKKLCESCHGSGEALTLEGETLITFLKKYAPWKGEK